MARQTSIGLLLLLITPIIFFGQVIEPYRYKNFKTNGRTPIALEIIRESDAFWSKRVWRVIDLREKINHPLYYPLKPINGRISLPNLILYGVYNGDFPVYDPLYDDFSKELSRNEIISLFISTDTITATRPFPPYASYDTIISTYLDPAAIIQVRIKEDWIFDKERSVMDVRILGICPVVESFDNEGEFRGYKPLFWIYYPHIRPLFASVNVYLRFNDAQLLSFDDVFIKRIFGSYIYKESNVYDRRISEYTEGMNALLEADRVKNNLFEFEHDLWEY